MKIYALFFSLLIFVPFNLFCMAAAAAASSVTRPMNYNDLMDDSVIRRELSALDCEDAMRLLYSKGKQDGTTSIIVIQEVPGRDGSKIDLFLHITPQSEGYKVTIYDSQQQACCDGIWNRQEASLDILNADRSHIPCLYEPARNVQGVTLLRIWDALWMMCGMQRCMLRDESSYEEFKLRILLPYVQGHTWYWQHGYRCGGEREIQEYKEAVHILTSRVCRLILEEHAQSSEVKAALENGCHYCECTLDVSLGQLVGGIYRLWRSATGQQRQDYKDCLLILYSKILKSYSRDAVLREAHLRMNRVYFEKINPLFASQGHA